jgi:hypothetical protein
VGEALTLAAAAPAVAAAPSDCSPPTATLGAGGALLTCTREVIPLAAYACLAAVSICFRAPPFNNTMRRLGRLRSTAWFGLGAEDHTVVVQRWLGGRVSRQAPLPTIAQEHVPPLSLRTLVEKGLASRPAPSELSVLGALVLACGRAAAVAGRAATEPELNNEAS